VGTEKKQELVHHDSVTKSADIYALAWLFCTMEGKGGEDLRHLQRGHHRREKGKGIVIRCAVMTTLTLSPTKAGEQRRKSARLTARSLVGAGETPLRSHEA